jgi:hypothetical protein
MPILFLLALFHEKSIISGNSTLGSGLHTRFIQTQNHIIPPQTPAVEGSMEIKHRLNILSTCQCNKESTVGMVSALSEKVAERCRTFMMISFCLVVVSSCLVMVSLWLIVISLHLVMVSLCWVVIPLCWVVIPLCLVMVSLRLVMVSLWLMVISLCFMMVSLYWVVFSFCSIWMAIVGLDKERWSVIRRRYSVAGDDWDIERRGR